MPKLILTPTGDTYISQASPNTNFRSSFALFTGNFTSISDVYRSILVFDTPVLLPETRFVNAYLRLYIYRKDAAVDQPVNVYRVSTAVDTSMVTFSTQPIIVKTSSIYYIGYDSVGNFIDIDVSDLVLGWIKKEYPNYGLELLGEENELSLTGFYSTNFIDRNLWPKLIVNYIFAGVSDYTGDTRASKPECTSVQDFKNRIYAVNSKDGNILVIDGKKNSVISTVSVGSNPRGICANSATNQIYAANFGSNNVSVIDGNTCTVTATVSVGLSPFGIGVNQTTNRIYVTNSGADNVSVISGPSNIVIAVIKVGLTPADIGVNSLTNRIYVANRDSNNVSVIDGNTNTVVDTVTVAADPYEVNVDSLKNEIYIIHGDSDNISVIDGNTNTVICQMERTLIIK